MILRVNAVQLHRFMQSGRNSPPLCGCEDEAGDRVDDFVVKLRGMESGQRGLLCELVASLLALYFSLRSPDPSLVVIEADFAQLVARGHSGHADLMRRSVGLNFGSRVLTNAAEWLVDQRLPEIMRQAALNIFAFDALIQNPDRRFNNQNLLARGDDIFVFDHELAFSFLHDVLPQTMPWRLEEQHYLSNHVFYRQLKSRPIDLSAFTGRLAELRGATLNRILADVPLEWNNEDVRKIEAHLQTVSEHAVEFGDEVRRRLS